MGRADERFPLFKTVIYGLSTMGYTIVETLVLTFCTVFYLAIEKGQPEKPVSGLIQLISNRNLGGFVTAIGLLFLFGRSIDSISDPLIATWSDRSKSRWGRRRFFLITSCFPLFIFTILIFFPPFQDKISIYNALHLGICLGAFYFFFTAYVCPYLSLIPELMPTDMERIRTTTIQAASGMVGSAVVWIGAWELISFFVKSDLFQGPTRVQQSYQTGIALVAFIGFVFLLPAIFVVDEKRYTKAVPTQIGLLSSLMMTLRNRPFILYVLGNITFNFAATVVRSIGAFYVLVLLRRDEEQIAEFMFIFFGASIVFFLPVIYLVKRVGKRVVMMIGNITFSLFMFFIFFVGMPFFDTDLFLFALFAIGALPLTIQQIVANAMLSSVAELDARENGQQRAAMFFGVQGLLQKISVGLAVVMYGALFSLFGKDIGNDLGVRLTGPISALVCLVGTFFFFLYPEKAIEEKLHLLRKEKAIPNSEHHKAGRIGQEDNGHL